MIELGLERISKLLAQTPLPWRAIHVAGTNGKGSVCTYISRMLEAFNHSRYRERYNLPSLRHGRFTSPHVVDRWDCITIDGRVAPARLFREVEGNVHARNRDEKIKCSEFELLTATAFEIFTRERVDVAVVEVGMGGRLDATNILGQRELIPPDGMRKEDFRPQPLVSAITKIGLDHQMFLGDTLTAVAREKAGIIKTGVPLIYDGTNEADVIAIFQAMAASKRTRAIPADSFDKLDAMIKFSSPATTSQDTHDAEHGSTASSNLDLSSLPDHTKQNISLALNTTWTALSRHIPTDSQVRNPFSSPPSASNLDSLGLIKSMVASAVSTPFPGRQQSLSIAALTGRQEPILLDGAHNAQSAEALSHAVSTLRDPSQQHGPGRKVSWVIAASDTKDATEILRPLIQPDDSVAIVQFGPVDGMPWVKASSCQRLAEATRTVVAEKNPHGRMSIATYGGNVRRALEAACDAADGGPVVVAGSLYLVGDVLRLLRDAEGSRHV